MNSKKLFRVVKIKNNDEDKYVIVCGKSRACEIEFKNEEEAWNYVDSLGLDWDIVVTVIGEMFEIFYNLKNKEK